MGMLHLYTGNGKGKTTAAVGMAVRAAGHGMKVLFCQFMKDGRSGELQSLRRLGITVWCSPVMEKLTFQMSPDEFIHAGDSIRASAGDALEILSSLHPDMVIFDELATALGCGLMDHETARKLVEACSQIETIITGRNAPEWIQNAADYLCIVESPRHPYNLGIEARIGVEL